MSSLDVVGSLVSCDDGGTEEPEASSSCVCETAPSTTTATDYDADDPYAPAECLRLRIGEDIDWSDVVVVAAVLERDDSTKGAAANPKCAARRTAAATARSSLSSAPAPAPRAAVAVVIGGGKATARDHGRRRRRSPCQCQLQLHLGGGHARVFSSSGEAAAAEAEAEPGSPKVSCLGGVRSHPQQPRTAADEGMITGGTGRRWPWAWLLVADVMFGCCWNGGGRRDRTEAEGERS